MWEPLYRIVVQSVSSAACLCLQEGPCSVRTPQQDSCPQSKADRLKNEYQLPFSCKCWCSRPWVFMALLTVGKRSEALPDQYAYPVVALQCSLLRPLTNLAVLFMSSLLVGWGGSETVSWVGFTWLLFVWGGEGGLYFLLFMGSFFLIKIFFVNMNMGYGSSY